MKMRSVLRLAVVAAVASCLGGAVRAQLGFPGIALKYGATEAPGVEKITYGNGLFLAVGGSNVYSSSGGITATSPDGFRWAVHTLSNNPIIGRISGVAAGNNNFVAVGNPGSSYQDPAGTNGLIQLSQDGVDWGQPVTIPSAPLSGVAYANGTYVAVGQSGGAAAIVTSSDGVHWNTRTFVGYGPLHAVTTGGRTFVTVGDAGAIFTSNNGLEWLTQVVLPGTNIYGVAYGNGMFVANAPDPAYILTSTNGTNWVVTPPSNPWNPPQWGAVAYGNGLFVGIGQNIYASTNGIDWTEIWIHGGAVISLMDVAYGAGKFAVLVGGRSFWNVIPRAFLGWSVETNGVVDLTLTGGWAGQSCRLQAATNLPATNWVDLFTFTNQGSVTYLQDPSATNYSQRFYRVAMP